MYKLMTLSSELGLNSLFLSRLTLCQLVPFPQMSNWKKRGKVALIGQDVNFNFLAV